LNTDNKIRTIEIRYDRVALGNLLNAWIKSYDALIVSSEKIRDNDSNKDIELLRVKLMLRGMAVESLLKTLAISRKIKLINNDGTLNKDFKKISHDLVGLAKRLEINLIDDEEKILRILTDSIETGRYPIPAKETLNNRFWIVPNYEDQFYKFLRKTIDIINTENANA
jgi:hypothetical protein